MMYLKLKVLSQERRFPLHLPQRSWRWGLLGSTWRIFTGQVHLVCLQLWGRRRRSAGAARGRAGGPLPGRLIPYLAGDVLHTVRVVGLLAGPAELPEIDLEGG